MCYILRGFTKVLRVFLNFSAISRMIAMSVGDLVATEERKIVLKAREAAEYLRISLFTLNKMERQGLLTPFRTPGGHRRYTLEMLNQLLEENRERS
jgi:excisionase family DNA binding protein